MSAEYTRQLSLLVSEISREQCNIIDHLNAISSCIECEDKLIDKVRLKIYWVELKRESVTELTSIISKIRNQLHNTITFTRLPCIREEDCDIQLDQLKIELYNTTLSMMKDGFVRETSISERGPNGSPFIWIGQE
jgi:hypothetical protein